MGIKNVKKIRENRIVEQISTPVTIVLFAAVTVLLGWLISSRFCLITLKILAGLFGMPTLFILIWIGVKCAVTVGYRKYRMRKISEEKCDEKE